MDGGQGRMRGGEEEEEEDGEEEEDITEEDRKIHIYTWRERNLYSKINNKRPIIQITMIGHS